MLLSAVGAFLLPNKYESSTTILVQRDEIRNATLVGYEMAVTMASEDRLRTFNEIIYSRPTLDHLMDSLYLVERDATETNRQEMTETIKRKITTERRGSDTFRISYVDTDPIRAQKAAALLSDLFIQTIVRLEGQRNELAVQFFVKKLEELRVKFEISQKQLVASLQLRINTMPTESRALYQQLENIELKINDIDAKTKANEENLKLLKTFPEAFQTESGKQSLFNLERSSGLFSVDFKILLNRYDDYSHRYTPKYPEVEKLEAQIIEIIERIRADVETEIAKQQPQRSSYEQRRAQLIDEIKQSSVSLRVDEDKESDYSIYRKLYDDMKVKLEQAQTSRDLGIKGANQFIIIDPAYAPARPSKPNRILLIVGGFCIGLFMGFVIVIVKEMLDTTIRSPRDIEVYQKPVIAFITEGSTKHQL